MSITLDERALDDLLDGIDVEAETKTPPRRPPRVHHHSRPKDE